MRRLPQEEALARPRRGTVWIVDDSKLEAERASRLLSQEYAVASFQEGAAMLEVLTETRRPDLLLLDWQMPGVSGLEVCRFLRERFDEVSFPILMLTSRGAKEDFAEGLSSGANDYVAKPYDVVELLARVRTLVRIGQQAKSLREREEWLSIILKSIEDAVIATDPAGRVSFLNLAAEQLSGWTRQEVLGRPLREVFRVADSATGSGGTRLTRRDETPLAIEYSSAFIGGEATGGTVIVFRDVTEKRKAEAEALSRADFQEKLIGIVSHDLRNPLSAILMGSVTLQSKLKDPSQTAGRIHRSAQRAVRLVNDLLDFTQARLGSGIPIRRAEVDLHQVARQVVEEVRVAYPGREVRFESAGDGRSTWDPDRLAQVLTNLIANAFQYGAEGAFVTVRTCGDAKGVDLSIHNFGKSIPEEIRTKLFEPMQRGVTLTDSTGRSVGLGLYIVKHIVDAHGGSIDVRSTEENGTTFVVHLQREGPAKEAEGQQ